MNVNQKRSTPQSAVGVDGGLLVVRSGAQLPPFCVKTDEPLNKSQYSMRQIKWTKSTKGRGIVMLLSYFTSRSVCKLAYGVTAAQSTKRTLLFVAKLIFAVAGIIGMFVAAVFGGDPLVMLSCLAVSIVSMALLPFGNQPLVIVREEDGVFWLKGYSKSFLKRLANRAT